MRLTLRTLLAYLDQILDQSDADELEQKIRESELATQLAHRIRSVLGQRRLLALGVDAEGLGRDANSVAEYLDNTLPTDQISDFERVCLESDVHLSEVAACHQILTLVLGEPAEVPEGLKEKIYRRKGTPPAIAEPSTQTPLSEPPLPSAPPTVPTPVTDESIVPILEAPGNGTRIDTPSPLASIGQVADTAESRWDEDEHWREAPDYLKRPRPGRWKLVAIVGLIAFCLVMAGLRGMGPLNRQHPLAQRLGLVSSTNVLAEADATAELPAAPSAAPGVRPSAEPAEIEPADSSAADSLAPPEDHLDSATADGEEAPTSPPALTLDAFPGNLIPDLGQSPDETTLPPEDATDTLLDEPEAETPSSPSDIASIPESDVGPRDDDLSSSISPATPEPTDIEGELSVDETFAEPRDEVAPTRPTLVNPLATSASPEPALPIPPLPTPRSQDDEPPIADAESTSPETEAPAAPEPARVVDIGRFLDPQQVLVRFHPESNLWQRVDVGTRLQVGDRLMCLPTYRSPLVLASGMQVNLIGGTRVEVLEPDAAATPYFRLDFGRLSVATFAQTGTSFGLHWSPDHQGLLTLADMNTTLAIQLHPQYVPGTDPTEEEPHQVLHVYVTSGSAEWTSGDNPAIRVMAGQRLTLIDNFPAILSDVDQQPTWIDGRDARPRDPIAARDLAQHLVIDRPATLVLNEEADSRRFEVRSLAVCSLAYLGDFDPLFVAINDSKLRSYWPAQYEVLSLTPSFSTEFTANVKSAIVQLHGEDDGMKLFRLLWGYSPTQLAEGGARELVDYLDHPSCDFRLVSSELLKSITGQASLYRANASERDPQRRAAISRWRKLLDEGQIIYAQPPEIVALLKEVAPQP